MKRFLSVPLSTGCAAGRSAAAPLHPWLQPVAPLGRRQCRVGSPDPRVNYPPPGWAERPPSAEGTLVNSHGAQARGKRPATPSPFLLHIAPPRHVTDPPWRGGSSTGRLESAAPGARINRPPGAQRRKTENGEWGLSPSTGLRRVATHSRPSGAENGGQPRRLRLCRRTRSSRRRRGGPKWPPVPWQRSSSRCMEREGNGSMYEYG